MIIKYLNTTQTADKLSVNGTFSVPNIQRKIFFDFKIIDDRIKLYLEYLKDNCNEDIENFFLTDGVNDDAYICTKEYSLAGGDLADALREFERNTAERFKDAKIITLDNGYVYNNKYYRYFDHVFAQMDEDFEK